ncbi:hypothetical protein JHK84_056379 [Glycine max]|nr:hypothetical protein JHK84_056379 [Glycine max]
MEDSVVVWDTGMDGAESDRFCVNERERELGSREVVHVLYGGPKRIGGESEVVRGSSWATRFGHVIVGFRHVSL